MTEWSVLKAVQRKDIEFNKKGNVKCSGLAPIKWLLIFAVIY